jgi:hypothetical protein
MTVTLKVTAGELDIVKGSTGVTVGGNSQNVTLTGTLVQINKLLNGESNGVITYLNDDDTPAGHVTLTLKADDNGHTGGGELYSTDTAIINIENLPEPPTGHEDHVITNAGKSAFNIAEWALLYNDTDPDTAHGNLDLAAGDGALSGYGNKDTAHHTDGTGQAGWVTFTDTNGNDGVFDYKLTDGSQEGTGHVTITQVSGSSINGTSGDDIIVGGSGDDTLNGRGGTDLIFGGAGDDTMIFGSTDRYDGGAGFDRIEVDASGGTTVTYEAGRFLGVEMVDLGDSDRFLGGENKFALNANDLVGVPTTTLGGHQVSLFVVGDHQSTFFSGNKDDVDLTNFKMTAVQTGVTFTDGATETQHTYNIYESNPLSGGGTVKVAIEAGLDVI